MKKARLKPETFREPDLEAKWQKVQPVLRKLKRWEKEGKFKELE